MIRTHTWEIKKKLVIDKQDGEVIVKYHFELDKKPKDFINIIFNQTLATELIRKGFTCLDNIKISVGESKNNYLINFQEGKWKTK